VIVRFSARGASRSEVALAGSCGRPTARGAGGEHAGDGLREHRALLVGEAGQGALDQPREIHQPPRGRAVHPMAQQPPAFRGKGGEAVPRVV
jgi:hypothetical protein